MNADQIDALLRLRHSKDLYIGECKNGPTQSANHRRLDAWVLVRTWSPPTVIGYEIKVTRQDWIRDRKFEDYRPMAHLLFVVAPKGIVLDGELPDGIGLLEATDKRLRMARKPIRREGPIDESTYQYVLMARVRADYAEHGNTREERVALWRQWAEGKDAAHTLGYTVRGRIAKEVEAMRLQVRDAKNEAGRYESIRRRIVELGFDPEKPVGQWEIGQKVTEAMKLIGPSKQQIQMAARSLKNALDVLGGPDGDVLS